MDTTRTHHEIDWSCLWDVLVIGAGPAGSVAAFEFAKQGLRVLVVDQSQFPRHKVCGGCLNHVAIQNLQDMGLSSVLSSLSGRVTRQLVLASNQHRLSLDIPHGVAVSRFQLDQALTIAAENAGVLFVSNVRAKPNQSIVQADHLEVPCETSTGPKRILTRLVVLANGLPNDSWDDPKLQTKVARKSRMGLGTVAFDFPKEYQEGHIYMAVGRSGYVGLTRIEGNRLSIAAAVDPMRLKAAESPGKLCREIVADAGLTVAESMFQGDWRGTVALTRWRRQPASHRIFAIGDAAGYIEPFTGAGMSWAIIAARAVVPFAVAGVENWQPSLAANWSSQHRKLLVSEQRKCRWLTRCLRSPLLLKSSMQAIDIFPSLGRQAVKFLTGSTNDVFSLGNWNSSPTASGEARGRIENVHRTAVRE